jgi:hypothetical protein
MLHIGYLKKFSVVLFGSPSNSEALSCSLFSCHCSFCLQKAQGIPDRLALEDGYILGCCNCVVW